MTRWAVLAIAGVMAGGTPAAAQAVGDYRFYVAAESEDEVALMRFRPGDGAEALTVEKTLRVGRLPAEIEAPHGVFVDALGEFWYLTLGHGFPNGTLLKYEVGADTVVGWTDLGLFPATVAVHPGGTLGLTVNSNFHGDHEPSTVSIVELDSMLEIARVETCTMPHGSRFTDDGSRHYSACMMDEQLVEIETRTLEVSRRLDLLTGAPPIAAAHANGGSEHAGPRRDGPCSPTWATPTPDGRTVYVPCNRGNRILEIDVESWTIARTFEAEGAPYNLAVVPDGSRLLATLKGGAAVGVWDLESGERVGVIPSTRRVTHGVVVTPDGRYAFVTVEGVGGEPGTVEVIDLASLQRVATADIGKQAGGIALLPPGSGL